MTGTMAMRLSQGTGLALREAKGLISLAQEMYSVPRRHYHDWNHAQYVFDICVALLADADIEDWERGGVLLAAIFHDVMYDARAAKGFNEEASTHVLAMSWNNWVGYEVLPSVLAEAKRLILLTVDHIAAPSDIGGQIVCDADLASFAITPYVEFQRQNDAIRQEYSFVSDEDWLAGRQAVLERYLYRNPLYYRLDSAYEQRATLNIVRAIRELRAAQALNERQQSESERYVCRTIVKRHPHTICGALVEPGERHVHGCPVEGDMCSARNCNETGRCQA